MINSQARPYAQAAFDYAVENNVLEDWESALKTLAIAVQDQQLIALLNNPAIEQHQLVALLMQTLKTDNTALKNFLLLLLEYKRLTIVPAVSEVFQTLKMQYEKHVDINVYAAFELNSHQTQKLQQAFAKKYGQQVTLHQHLAPELIGGLRVRVGDTVFDNSILDKINRFKAHLNLKETVCQ